MSKKLPPINTDGVARRIEDLRSVFSDQKNAFDHLATKVRKGHDKAVGELIEALFANVKDLKADLANAGLVHTAMTALLEAENAKYKEVQAIRTEVGRDTALVSHDVELANAALRTAGETTNEVRELLHDMTTKYDKQFAEFQADQREQLDELTSGAREQIATLKAHQSEQLEALISKVLDAYDSLVRRQHGQFSKSENQQQANMVAAVHGVADYLERLSAALERSRLEKEEHATQRQEELERNRTMVTRDDPNSYKDGYHTQMAFAFKF